MSTKENRDPELGRITRRNRKHWEAVPSEESAIASSRLGAMISVRFEPDVAKIIRQAARIQNITQSEFVRRSAEAAAQTTVQSEPVAVESFGDDRPALVWKPSSSMRPRQERVISTATSLAVATKG